MAAKPPDGEPQLLGAELAAASAIEAVRSRHELPPSPLAELAYRRNEARIASPSFERCNLDERLREVTEAWERIDLAELATIRSALNMDDFSTLMTYARRAAVLGLREEDPTWPRSAFTAMSTIAYERIDARDLTWAAALAAFSLGHFGHAGDPTVRRAAERSGKGTAEVLGRFAARSPENLDSWGYTIVGTGSALRFVGQGYKPYAPTCDLLGAAEQVGRAIGTERGHTDGHNDGHDDTDRTDTDPHDVTRYDIESITVATDVPKVWFGGNEMPPEVLAARESIVAGATVRATPRSTEAGPAHMFVVFLAECGSPTDAAHLADATGRVGLIPEHAHLAVTNGALLAVLISRSTVPGIDGLEDNRSLQRFAAGLSSALASC